MAKDVIDISGVRVAGIGGLGLVFMALVVGTQYPLIMATLVAGLAGGAVAALAVILARRASRATPPEPGARTMLVTGRESREATPADTHDHSPRYANA